MNKGLFAPVAPIHILEKLHETNDLGAYHLVLAHDVLKNKQRFKNLFGRLSYALIIVDNSVIELEHPIAHEQILEACEVFLSELSFSPTVVAVLPDELMDATETVHRSVQALNAWQPWKEKYKKLKFMFVPQGKDFKQFIACAEVFRTHISITHIDWIGVARNIQPFCPNKSRQVAVNLLEALFPAKNQHLLGFSDDIWDDVLSVKHKQVIGIDSAVPLRLHDRQMFFSDDVYPPRPKDWWDTAQWTDNVRINVRRFRGWIGDSTGF